MSDPAAALVRVVITDANILINLTHIGRLDLLGKLPPYSFVVPGEVVQEVKEPAQMEAIQTAIASGLLQVVQLTASQGMHWTLSVRKTLDDLQDFLSVQVLSLARITRRTM